MRQIARKTRRAQWYDAAKREAITASELRSVVACRVDAEGKVRTNYGVAPEGMVRPLTMADCKATDRGLAVLATIEPAIDTPELDAAIGHLTAAIEEARDRAAAAKERLVERLDTAVA